MEWFSFVTPVTGLIRPNTGKEDDDYSDYNLNYKSITCVIKVVDLKNL
jgi:hypothetical protein